MIEPRWLLERAPASLRMSPLDALGVAVYFHYRWRLELDFAPHTRCDIRPRLGGANGPPHIRAALVDHLHDLRAIVFWIRILRRDRFHAPTVVVCAANRPGCAAGRTIIYYAFASDGEGLSRQ